MQGPGAAHPHHEELLAQREWIRGLARALAADEATADDLEQETLAAALRSPPPGGGFPRAWLATVMRNFARRGHRDAGRARRREENAARPEAGDDAATVVARAEAHGRVVDAVLALPEPARTAVLLRFYDGLPPREVARRTGVPVETARTRLKRALADLRGRLGGERGREGLLGLLVPLLRPDKGIAAGVTGGIAMSTAAKVAFAAGVAALATAGVVAWRAAGTGDEVPPPAEVAAAPAPVPTQPKPRPPSPPAAMPVLPPRVPPPAKAEPPMEPVAPKPSMVERLAEVVPVSWDGVTVGDVVLGLAHHLDLEPEYETEELRQLSFSSRISAHMEKGLKIQEALTLALHSVASPVAGKVVSWDVRNDRLFVRSKENPDEAARRQNQEDEFLRSLRARRTSFIFDGQTLPEALSFIAAQQGVNIVVNDPDMAKARAVIVVLSLKDVPVNEALDELVRLDPDLLWELRGNVVLVRKK